MWSPFIALFCCLWRLGTCEFKTPSSRCEFKTPSSRCLIDHVDSSLTDSHVTACKYCVNLNTILTIRNYKDFLHPLIVSHASVFNRLKNWKDTKLHMTQYNGWTELFILICKWSDTDVGAVDIEVSRESNAKNISGSWLLIIMDSGPMNYFCKCHLCNEIWSRLL